MPYVPQSFQLLLFMTFIELRAVRYYNAARAKSKCFLIFFTVHDKKLYPFESSPCRVGPVCSTGGLYYKVGADTRVRPYKKHFCRIGLLTMVDYHQNQFAALSLM